MRSILARLRTWSRKPFRSASLAAPRPTSRPEFEQLESRLVPTVTYHGGPLLTNVGVEAVFYGADWQNNPILAAQTTDIANFLTYIVDSPYMDMLQNAGYGVGRGQYLGGTTDPADLSAGADDGQIRNELLALIDNGALQPPDDNRLYFVFAQPGAAAGGADSGSGYHTSFTAPDGSTINYAVVTSGIDATTGAASWGNLGVTGTHELGEAVTDSNNGWWDDDLTDQQAAKGLGTEIGDIVNGQTVPLNGYYVQKMVDQNDQPIAPDGSTSILPSSQDVTATAGQAFSGTVATFWDMDNTVSADNYTAQIDWGDGQTSDGQIVDNGDGTFSVTGANTYGQSGSYTIQVQIDDTVAGDTAAASSTATVNDPPDAPVAPTPLTPAPVVAVPVAPASVVPAPVAPAPVAPAPVVSVPTETPAAVPAITSTSTTLAVNPAKAFFGDTITVTANVTSGAAVPPGTVTFFDGTTPLGGASLNASGTATLTVSALARGGHSLTAAFPARGDFGASTSAPAAVTVVLPTTSSVGAYDPASGTWYLRNHNSAGGPDAGSFAYGGPGFLPIVGDWNGDGVVTVGVYEEATGRWLLRNSNTSGAPDISFTYGGPGFLPVVGDWNGDGKTTIGVYEEATGRWLLRNSNTSGAPDVSFVYGGAGLLPVAGDWNGEGVTTVGVYEVSTGRWLLRNSNTAGGPDIAPFAYGGPGLLPVVGSWNGDGVSTVGVFSTADGRWLLRNSNTAGPPDVAAFAFGAGAWTPVAGNWTGLPLLAAGGPLGTAAPALGATVTAALDRLASAGVDSGLVRRLAAAHYGLGTLPPDTLGLAEPAADAVLLSPDAAGRGWFVDNTPLRDEEFVGGQAAMGSVAAGRMDLLTVVLHEMGHLVGRQDVAGRVAGDGLMADALPTGVRRTEGLDRVFAALGTGTEVA